MTVTSKMQDILHALEKVDISSTPTDDKIFFKKSTTVESSQRYIQCTKFSEKNVNKKISEFPHLLKIFHTFEKKYKFVADKNFLFLLQNTLLQTHAKKKKIPPANCVIVIVTKLVMVVSIQMSHPEKLGAENWIFEFYVLAHDTNAKAVKEILINYTFNVTNVKRLDMSLPYASS